MEQKLAGSTAVHWEILSSLHAAGEVENMDLRDLIDLAKIGGFVTVVVDHQRLSELVAAYMQMDTQERLVVVRGAETQVSIDNRLQAI